MSISDSEKEREEEGTFLLRRSLSFFLLASPPPPSFWSFLAVGGGEGEIWECVISTQRSKIVRVLYCIRTVEGDYISEKKTLRCDLCSGIRVFII